MGYRADVVVVGCGGAGLSAAVAAAQEGATVHVLERSPKAERGGNSRYTEGNVKLKSATEVADDFTDGLVQTSETYVQPSLLELTLKPYDQWPAILRAYGFADPELIKAFADGAPGTIAWLSTFGIRFEQGANPASAAPERAPVGGGQEVVERLAQAAETRGVIFHYETTGRSLTLDDQGVICGLRGWSKTEGQIDLASKAVVLASGGFEGNQEMCTKYLGRESYHLRPVSQGGMYNKGEGIEMALRVGAAPAGQYDGFHAMICDPRSVHHESVKPWNYGILVNARGERFIDEGSDYREIIKDNIARGIWRQPYGKAYFVYDAKIKDIRNYQRQIGSEFPPITGRTIEELATNMGVSPAALKNTIQSFNAAVQEGGFTPITPDGKHTKGITPPKSNWARTIEGPELMAYPVVCTNVFTFGGIRVSPRSQVVNCDGYEIPGLFAAGEVIGMYYGFYPSATSFLRGLVFGRLAGRNAVSQR